MRGYKIGEAKTGGAPKFSYFLNTFFTREPPTKRVGFKKMESAICPFKNWISFKISFYVIRSPKGVSTAATEAT